MTELCTEIVIQIHNLLKKVNFMKNLAQCILSAKAKGRNSTVSVGEKCIPVNCGSQVTVFYVLLKAVDFCLYTVLVTDFYWWNVYELLQLTTMWLVIILSYNFPDGYDNPSIFQTAVMIIHLKLMNQLQLRSVVMEKHPLRSLKRMGQKRTEAGISSTARWSKLGLHFWDTGENNTLIPEENYTVRMYNHNPSTTAATSFTEETHKEIFNDFWKLSSWDLETSFINSWFFIKQPVQEEARYET